MRTQGEVFCNTENEEIKPRYEEYKEKAAASKIINNKVHKEEIAAYHKAHYDANKEEILTYQKEYNKVHREEISAYHKAYYDANKEEIAACMKAYRETKREEKKTETEAKREAKNELKKSKLEAQKEAKKAQRDAKREAKLAQSKITKNSTSDHLGNEFRSKASMCNHYNIDRITYLRRLQRGWTQEEALMVPADDKHNGLVATDYLGNEFDSISEMCRSYGIDVLLYFQRVSHLGWTPEEALTVPVGNKYNGIITTDHLGNKFNSISEMCRSYSMNYDTYDNRVSHLGWTLEEALTIPLDTEHTNKRNKRS